jgi:hypothetical protein
MPHGHNEDQASPGPLSIVVVGNDALIDALPALPIQLAHACLAAGFDQAVPLSWGDELVADAVLRALNGKGQEGSVLCACPLVRQRLLGSGTELAPMLVTPPAPPIALARYLRRILGPRLRTLAYVGRCPAGRTPEYDVAYAPEAFLELLRRRGIDVLAQPQVFDAVLPPDRRRYASLPGGCPSPEALWQRSRERTLVTLTDDEDLPTELAQHLLHKTPTLLDPAPALGCACSGVTTATDGQSARIAVMSLEPPRSRSPILDVDAGPPPPPDSPTTPPAAPPSGTGAATDQTDAPTERELPSPPRRGDGPSWEARITAAAERPRRVRPAVTPAHALQGLASRASPPPVPAIRPVLRLPFVELLEGAVDGRAQPRVEGLARWDAPHQQTELPPSLRVDHRRARHPHA